MNWFLIGAGAVLALGIAFGLGVYLGVKTGQALWWTAVRRLKMRRLVREYQRAVVRDARLTRPPLTDAETDGLIDQIRGDVTTRGSFLTEDDATEVLPRIPGDGPR